jgi:hypothetical protein
VLPFGSFYDLLQSWKHMSAGLGEKVFIQLAAS